MIGEPVITDPDSEDNTNLYTIINININFIQDTYTYEYNSIGDVISSIGGLKAALGPFINIFNPILALFFLLMLTKIIK